MPRAKSTMALVPVGTVVSTTNVSARTRRNRRRRQRRRRARGQVSSTGRGSQRTTRRNVGSMANLASQAYVDNLNDPFDYPPVPLGLGTMIPTECSSAYIRNQFALNADGSGTIVFIPNLINGNNTAGGGAFISINNLATATAPTWATQFNAANATQLTADFDQYRLLSAAIRILPLQAQTAVPGVMNAGVVAPDSSGNVPGGTGTIASATTTLISSWPELETFMGYEPIQVVWRPSELSDYDFSTQRTTTLTTNVDSNVPVCVATFSGFPASTTIYFEAVAHIEGYASTKIVGFNNVGELAKNVASEQPSVDSLWQYAVKRIGPTVSSLGSYLAAKGIDMVSNYSRQMLFPQSNFVRQIANRSMRRPQIELSSNPSVDFDADEKQFSNISSPLNSPIPSRIPIRKVKA